MINAGISIGNHAWYRNWILFSVSLHLMRWWLDESLIGFSHRKHITCVALHHRRLCNPSRCFKWLVDSSLLDYDVMASFNWINGIGTWSSVLRCICEWRLMDILVSPWHLVVMYVWEVIWGLLVYISFVARWTWWIIHFDIWITMQIAQFVEVNLDEFFRSIITSQPQKLLYEGKYSFQNLVVLNILRIVVTERCPQFFKFGIRFRYEIL